MKRIICAFFAALLLISTFAVAVSAEVETTATVLKELETLKIDGKAFSEADYPVNTENKTLSVLAVSEVGYLTSSSSPTYALYLYVYNPSKIAITDNSVNSVQLGLNDQCDEYFYRAIKLLSKSPDNRFLKFKVVDSGTYGYVNQLYRKQESDNERVYNVVSFRVFVSGKLMSYTVDKTFFFSGFDYMETLTCSTKKLGALDVELHDTNWISPNAGIKTDGSEATIYDHYEINSVYFRVPKSYFDNYGNLKSIRAIYDAVRLTPIILTREGDFGDVTKNAILDGDVIESGGDVDVMDLICKRVFGSWYYSEMPESYVSTMIQGAYRKNTLAYYFECLDEKVDYDDAEVWKSVVSSEELEQYFYERYNDPYYDESKLYSELKQGLMIDYNSRDYDGTALWDMTTYGEALAKTSKFNQWWTKLTTEKDSYRWDDFNTTAEHIKVITDPSQYMGAGFTDATKEACANELFISFNDVGDFVEECTKAAANNEYVVLLRFAFSDYYCEPIKNGWEALMMFGPTVGLVVEKWAYMNINVARLVFCDNGVDVVVPTASNTVDSFGDLDGFGDDSLDPDDITDTLRDKYGARLAELWKDIKTVLLILAICAVVVFVIWIVLRLKPQKVKIDYGDRHKRE